MRGSPFAIASVSMTVAPSLIRPAMGASFFCWPSCCAEAPPLAESFLLLLLLRLLLRLLLIRLLLAERSAKEGEAAAGDRGSDRSAEFRVHSNIS
jgi:hypothetical protein